MNKRFNFALLIFAALVISNPSKCLAGQDGNAAGGMWKNDRWMTFYSAGFYIEKKSKELTQIPQLQETISEIRNLKGLTQLNAAKYLVALEPGRERKYFKVKEDFFTAEVKARLIAEYARVMNIAAEGLTLYAVSDQESKQTYLLPNFYHLNPTEKKAILLHEAYWIANPLETSYDKVIQVEMVAQAYFEDIHSRPKRFELLRMLGNDDEFLKYVFFNDLEFGELDSLLTVNFFTRSFKFFMKDLFGEEYSKCLVATHENYNATDICEDLWYLRVIELQQEYPNSEFIKILDLMKLSSVNIEQHYYPVNPFIVANRNSRNRKVLFIESATIQLDKNEYHPCLVINWGDENIINTDYCYSSELNN